MFSTVSENRVRIIRWALVLGWCLLTLSLFADPLSSRLTMPENRSSPFRLHDSASLQSGDTFACPFQGADGRVDWAGLPAGECAPQCARVRDVCLIERPYPMGARFFWTMCLPLLPLAFMLLGHEAWRRVCPLSAIAQIPRRLGLGRKKPILQRKTGKLQWGPVFIRPDSWIGRHPSVLPFVLLCVGVTLRLLFINSDRMALGIFFLLVMASAIWVGAMFGGKTWCHYICPLSPVQKIYTEPRGLLESAPHLSKRPLPQSMCRKSGQSGDISACVGCISPCPDIDLEHQHWTRIREPGRRFVHYGYVGMIFGFYGYYYLFAGNWRYYFSGAWTHEEQQLSQLRAPGFYWLDNDTWMEKWLAAPLTMACSVLVAYLVGIGLERVFRALQHIRGRRISDEEFRHRALVLSGAVALNSFYFFGGRPNINLLHPVAVALLEVSIVAVSVMWLTRAWNRNPRVYTMESLASRLRRQLAKSPIDLRTALDGRSIEELSHAEVYALGKVLPQADAESRRTIYKDTLRDAFRTASVIPGVFGQHVQGLRAQLQISEEEHQQVMAELGVSWESASQAGPKENVADRWRLESYRGLITEMVTNATEKGQPLAEVMASDGMRKQIALTQEAYQITDELHAQVVGELMGGEGMLMQSGQSRLRRIRDLRAFAAAVAGSSPRHSMDERRVVLARSFLILELQESEKQVVRQTLAVALSLEPSSEANVLMRGLANAAPECLEAVLRERRDVNRLGATWETAFGEELRSVAEAQIAHAKSVSGQERLAQFGVDDICAALLEVESGETTLWAGLLAWLTTVDTGKALEVAAAPKLEKMHFWLLDETKERVTVSSGTDYPPALDWMMHLRRMPYYRKASTKALAELVRRGHVEDMAQDETLCAQGAPSDDLICMLAGKARVEVERSDGSRFEVGEVAPGETVGELGVINQEPRSATVRVSSPRAKILRIDRVSFEQYLSHESQNMLHLVSQRLSSTLRKSSTL